MSSIVKDFLARAAARAELSDIVLWLAPQLQQMPLPMQRFDEPFLPFSKAIISATRDHVWGYAFDLAAYFALGAAGIVALERAIAFARAGHDVFCALHGPFASGAFAAAVSDSALAVDAVTISTEEAAAAFFKVGVMPLMVGAMVGTAGGRWSAENDAVELVNGVRLRVLGHAVLYAGRGDSFAEDCRDAILMALGDCA